MRSCYDGDDVWGAKPFLALSFIFFLLGSWAGIAGNQAYAQERILLRGVPYFHQRWHFD
jgi:hypothetical protein